MTTYTLKDITRPSGGFAMLAVDQREAMRLMFAAAGAPQPVADRVLTDFKVNAARTLSPFASAILVDQQFCYRQVVEQQAKISFFISILPGSKWAGISMTDSTNR